MMKKMIALLGLVASLVTGHASGAVQLQVTDGILTGATGVNVNGVLYDVAFQDGSCVSLFGGCKSSEFAFRSIESATAAAQALLDVVFVNGDAGSFDSIPNFTRGCSVTSRCQVITPLDVMDVNVSSMLTANESGDFDGVLPADFHSSIDTTFAPAGVYAVWSLSPSPVPVPPTFGLAVAAVLSGFAAVLLRKRR